MDILEDLKLDDPSEGSVPFNDDPDATTKEVHYDIPITSDRAGAHDHRKRIRKVKESEPEVQFLEKSISYKCPLCDSPNYDVISADPLHFLEHMANHAEGRLPTSLSSNRKLARFCAVYIKRIEDELSEAVTETFSTNPPPPPPSSIANLSFTCVICALILDKKEALERHLILHSTAPAVDPRPKIKILAKNILTMTKDQINKLPSGTSKYKPQNQMHRHKGSDPRPLKEKVKFPCRKCQMTFTTNYSARRHMTKRHPELDLSS